MFGKWFRCWLSVVLAVCCPALVASQTLGYESFAMDPAMSDAAVSPDGKIAGDTAAFFTKMAITIC